MQPESFCRLARGFLTGNVKEVDYLPGTVKVRTGMAELCEDLPIAFGFRESGSFRSEGFPDEPT